MDYYKITNEHENHNEASRYKVVEEYRAFDRKGGFVCGGDTAEAARMGAAKRGVARVVIRCVRSCGTHPTPLDHQGEPLPGDPSAVWRCSVCKRISVGLGGAWRFLADGHCPACGWLVSQALVCGRACEARFQRGEPKRPMKKKSTTAKRRMR